MKRGSQLSLKINSIKFPSTGVSECEGKKIYVKGAFPGQTEKATVKKNREGYAEAKLVEVIEKADKIIVFDEGHIVEEGTHEELLNLNGLYKTLYEAQKGEAQNENA